MSTPSPLPRASAVDAAARLPRPSDVPPVARRQGGVFSTAQAVDAGWTVRQVRRRLEVGRWVRVAGVAMAAHDHPASSQPGGADGRVDAGRDTALPVVVARAWAAALTWPRSVVAGPTAAALHGIPAPADPRAHVVVHPFPRPRAGLVAHAVPLADREIEFHPEGVLVTAPLRTTVDCLAWASRDEALDLWAWVSTRRTLSRAQLAAAVRSRAGRHGCPDLLHLLDSTRCGAVSVAEGVLHDLLRRASVTGWEAGVLVRDAAGTIGVVDVLFPAARVVLEVDGWRTHSSQEAFVRDRRRQNRLVAAGYVVLRFSWTDLLHRPDEVVEQVRRCVAAAA